MAKELQPVPGFSQGVRINSAMRTLKVNAPICPNSQPKYEVDLQGRRVRVDRGPDEQNCQMAGGQWWIMCEQKGHDPYFRNRVWYTTEDIFTTDDQGREIANGTQRIRHEDRSPNVNQVPVARRMHQGKGVQYSMERKGRRRLTEAGYQEVCQFRNCMKPVRFHNTAFGDYCSQEHLQAVAADAQGTFLPQIMGFEGGSEERIKSRRDQMLREAVAGSTTTEAR